MNWTPIKAALRNNFCDEGPVAKGSRSDQGVRRRVSDSLSRGRIRKCIDHVIRVRESLIRRDVVLPRLQHAQVLVLNQYLSSTNHCGIEEPGLIAVISARPSSRQEACRLDLIERGTRVRFNEGTHC